MQMLFVITAMVLAIKSLNAGKRTYNHIEAGIETMLCKMVNTEHMEVKDLPETKGEMSLKEKEVH